MFVFIICEMVRVVNKKTHKPTPNDFYIGRGSVLGNPYYHVDTNHSQALFKLDTRDECVDAYERYFTESMDDNDEFSNTIKSLVDKCKRGDDINLVCFCKPERCHGDVIREYLEETLWK